jgi:transcription initiation factor TFIID subunit TAF12
LGKLLEREIDLPTRYAITARLMEADIKPLKEDSLDEISRLMNDVERRLALGRTGKMVRDKQQAIIDKLDKSIDQIEQQMQQQQQQQKQKKQQQQKKNQDQSKPQDQVPTEEVKGPGEIDPKDIGNSASWGNLPPAQRQEALQNMTKDLPSHYREVIEAYFKRLSTTNK